MRAPATGPAGRSPRARFAAAGLDPDAAERHLRGAGLWSDDADDPLAAVADLVAAASPTAAPPDALRVLVDVVTTQPDLAAAVRADRGWLDRAAALAGASRPLGDLLVRDPGTLRALERPAAVAAPDVAAAVADALGAVVAGGGEAEDPEAMAAAVAAIRRRTTAAIAARDLTGETTVEAAACELAALAEGVLTGALRVLHRSASPAAPAARIAVIGMGKLGGEELNYVSDVDVIFVHAPTGGDDRAAADEARTVIESLLGLLNATTTMGRAYEVDPTLRPEGRDGPLSRTIPSFTAYWERWARTWEFQALVKARVVAGDRRLGTDLLLAAEPFVWPDALDVGVIAEIREMKGRTEAKPQVRRHGERQLKLGPGGLRDIEFAVQLLQLVHGRADHSLRVTGTLPALEALAGGGYVADDDAATFAEAYRRLRAVEHRLQLAQERRTHTIPADERRQEWLARSLGYRATAADAARTGFLRDLRRVQGQVRELHAKLFYRPLLEVPAALPAATAGVALPEAVRAMGPEAAAARLVALGFRDGAAALRHVRAMTDGVSRRARTVRAALPSMLAALQDSPDPDTGLRMLRRLVEARPDADPVFAHLRDHPPDAELLARVLGTSEVAGELLLDLPQGVEWLRDPAVRDTGRDRDELVRLAQARLAWQDPGAALRRFKRHELLRIVVRDLAGAAGVTAVGRELTALGEACLCAAVDTVLEAEAREAGVAPDRLPVRVVVVGMGRFGGRELGYVSDLDVLFVHEALPGHDEAAATVAAARIAEGIIRTLGEITAEGTAFEVDAELRPEGRSGPLSRSLASLAGYYERWSAPWEHQALLRARPVAGDADLAERCRAVIRRHAYPDVFTDEDARAMRRMKARIERDRIPGRVDPARHLKLGPGGMADVEWVVQLLQRRHGHAVPIVRSTSTMQALDGLQDAALVEHRDAQWLRDAYRFLALIRNRLYLLRERSTDVLPTRADQVERLARSLGYGRGGRQSLEDDVLRHMRRVRRVVAARFYEVDEADGTP